jgi:DNA-binding NtrC family response regulator
LQNLILIVEDGAQISKMIKSIPSLKAYTIFYANSVKQAFTILEQKGVDVIVSDEYLSDMSGIEFLAIARQKCPDAIQMIFTGDTSLKSVIRAINDGKIYRLFSKPYNVVDLAITIHCVLHKKRYLKRMMNIWPQAYSDDLPSSGAFSENKLVLQSS